LKMILAGAQAAAVDRARFKAEAEAVARLQHPNIVQVYEIGEHLGRPYFSLEFCSGGSLEDRLDRRPMPPNEAAELAQTLARAAHHAHQQAIVHRDLKPANILLQKKSEIQNSKSETNPKPEIQNPKPADGRVSVMGDWNLGLVSDFEFRISDF